MSAGEDSDEAEHYRREAIGAFVHEVRTPLTSLRMVMELARRQSNDGQLFLDAELAQMLSSSLADLQRLADGLQEGSRLERGKLPLSRGPCHLPEVVETAREVIAGEHIALAGSSPAAVQLPWDAARLVRAIAAFAGSANRIGDGSGVVRLSCEVTAGSVRLVFGSGEPCPGDRPIAADAGFSFFHARQLVVAMGGSVHCDRADRSATITVALPTAIGS